MYDWRTKTNEQIAKFVHSQHTTLKGIRKPMEPLMDMVTKLFLPRTHDMMKSRNPDDPYGVVIYDHVPADSARKFASGFVSQTVSKRDESDQSWVNFVADTHELMEIDNVKQYMQKVAEQVRTGFDKSTFYRDTAYRQQVHDASVLWGVMTAEKDLAKDRVVFRRRDPRNHWFGINRFGEIDVDHFELTMTAKDLVEQFDKKMLPSEITEKITGLNPDPFAKYTVIWAIYVNGSIRKGFHHNTDKPFMQFYVLQGAKSEAESLIAKEGIDWRPSVLRIGETLVSGYPLSMAMDALTAATYGNVLSKHGLLQSHLMAQPPKRIHENLRAQILKNHLNPDSNTYFSSEEEKIEYLTQNIDPRYAEEWINREGNAVEERFFVHFFELITRLQAQGGTPPTATQIREAIGERIGQLTPVIEASEDDSLEPNVDVIWQYETMAGRMPGPEEVPPELFVDRQGRRIDKPDVLNRFNGQLAHLKRTLRQNQGIVEALAIIREFKELYPSSLIVVRAKKLLERALANRIGQDMILTEPEVAQIEAALAEVQQEEAQMERAERMSKIIPSVTKDAVNPESPLALAAAG